MAADPERNEVVSGLLCRLAGDDQGAMQELFDRERSSLFRYFVRLGRCEVLAEDLLQNTFLSLWRYRNNFREGIKGPAYLYRVALNEWRQNFTREKRRQDTLEASVNERESVQVPAPDAGIVEDERRQSVWRAIDALPDSQRETFILHRFEGLSCREIATVTGDSGKTVESRLRLALEKLTGALKPQEGRL